MSSEVTDRLARLEERLDALTAALDGAVHPDDVAGVRSLAEDALARSGNAQAIAEDALARAAESDGRGLDALARADNAQAAADGVSGRLVDAEAKAADAMGRADNAQAAADGVSDRLVEAEAKGADALARAGNAQTIAEDAASRTAEVEGRAVDALGRADNAQAAADGVSDRLVEVEAKGADAVARAGNAQAVAEDALEQAAEAARQSGDAAQGAENAVAAADAALGRLSDLEGREADALARADHAQAVAGDALVRAGRAATSAEDAIQRAAGAQARADDAAATATLARDAALEALMPARIAAFGAWLELSPPPDDLPLSVILSTRDRPALLGRAVASVVAQRYPSWQLVVVDDGDTDAVATTLASVDDARVAIVEGPRRGLGAARNAGLDAATGDVVCYLDDDNVMHPAWLSAVARVFAERDDVDVAYGVTVSEHRAPGGPGDEGWWPAFWQLPWSRETLLDQNVTDAGALAHRRGLDEARFDEEVVGEDWDLLIRLTAERSALAVPAVSHAYTMSGGDHMRQDAGFDEALDEVRRRHAGE